MLYVISDCHASKRVPEALADVEPHAAASIRQKCIWMETIRIKLVPSVPGSFLLLARHLFCPIQPHKLFLGMNSTFPVKEQPCKCFLAAYAYITNGYCWNLFTQSSQKALSVEKYSWRTLAGQHGQLRQLAQVAPLYPKILRSTCSECGHWPSYCTKFYFKLAALLYNLGWQ